MRWQFPGRTITAIRKLSDLDLTRAAQIGLERTAEEIAVLARKIAYEPPIETPTIERYAVASLMYDEIGRVTGQRRPRTLQEKLDRRTGDLGRSIRILRSEVVGDVAMVEVGSDISYARFVEFGWHTKTGRFVPGKAFMTKATDRICPRGNPRSRINTIMSRAIREKWAEVRDLAQNRRVDIPDIPGEE